MREGVFQWIVTFLGAGVFSLLFILYLWYPAGLSREQYWLHWAWFGPLIIVWLSIAYIFGLLEPRVQRKKGVLARSLVSAWVVSVVAGALAFYAQPDLLLTPRRFLLAVVSLIFFLFWILVLAGGRAKKIAQSDLYYLGHDGSVEKWLSEISSPDFVFKGFPIPEKLVYGDTVVTPGNFSLEKSALKSLIQAKRAGVRFVPLATWCEVRERRLLLTELSDLWSIQFGGGKRKIYDRVKRVLDIVAGVTGVVLLVIIYVPVAVCVKLSSPGKAFFKQPRVGLHGRVFYINKFRTMRENPGDTWTENGDIRITTFGKFLRRWGIDELPQVWNVLKGDMSLVGPRPEQVHIVKKLEVEVPFFEERHAVSPGLTGWAQLHVYAGTLEESKRKLEYDLYYIKHRSLWFDIEIILKTFAWLFLGRL